MTVMMFVYTPTTDDYLAIHAFLFGQLFCSILLVGELSHHEYRMKGERRLMASLSSPRPEKRECFLLSTAMLLRLDIDLLVIFGNNVEVRRVSVG